MFSAATLEELWDDFDAREVLLRQVVAKRMNENPPPSVPDHFAPFWSPRGRCSLNSRPGAEEAETMSEDRTRLRLR